MIFFEPFINFLLYFVVAIVAEAAFIALYIRVTPHREMALIRQGNTAAAISLGGAVLGFTLPLASVIAHSVSLIDLAIWGVIALLVQLVAYLIVDVLLREVSRQIDAGNIAAATMLATGSVAIGLLNAACMTY
jgi:putative membrane protein